MSSAEQFKNELVQTSSSDELFYNLSSGYKMPAVAYGTFRSEKGEVGQAVLEAIKAGYRHFDLAHVYGNEKEIGKAFIVALIIHSTNMLVSFMQLPISV